MSRTNRRRAVVLGGTGAIGYATARRLLASGWRVTLTGRDPSHLPPGLEGAAFVVSDRDDPAGPGRVLGRGADLLVDCACHTAAHARNLLAVLRDVTGVVMISSKAVYVDGQGRHPNSPEPPRFDGPITEAQATLGPSAAAPFDSREGYGANKAAAEAVLLGGPFPVTVLRPSKVHGAWSRRPREWMFVRRVLDARKTLILAHRGAGVDHPSAAVNIAALIEVVADRPGWRVLNAADPDSPSAAEIARTVARRLGHRFDEVLLDADAPEGLGRHPWDAPSPIVLDTSAARGLGYRPVGDYAATVGDEIDWLVDVAARGAPGWPAVAADDPFFAPLFDYAAEERYLARARRMPRP